MRNKPQRVVRDVIVCDACGEFDCFIQTRVTYDNIENWAAAKRWGKCRRCGRSIVVYDKLPVRRLD